MSRVAILGSSGFGGGELLRLLAAHPKIDGLSAITRTHAGKPVSSVHPNLRRLVDIPFQGHIDWAWLAESERPVLFSAMPHGELAKQWPDLEGQARSEGIAERLTVIDLSADFRLAGDGFVYGLPEWDREAIRGARRIANPGCFATALQLALLPLAGRELGLIAVSGLTGSSGSGASPIDATHHPTRAHDLRAYKILTHQHEAEVKQLMKAAAIKGVLSFVPHSAPLVRGIFATMHLLIDGHALRALYEETYRDDPFIRVVDDSPRLASVNGSNFADIGVVSGEGSAVVMVALDNLLKGMAGTAVQNMNLALGHDERLGLWDAAPYPG